MALPQRICSPVSPAFACLLMISLAACRPDGESTTPSENTTATPAPSPAGPRASEIDPYTDPARSDADRERDAGTHPEQIIPLLALEPGDRVLDFLAGGGYWSQMLGSVVGPDGAVLVHNNAAFRQWVGPGLGERLAAIADRPQLQRWDRELDDLGLDPGSLAAILLVNTYHDFYFADAEHGWPAFDAGPVMDQLVAGLESGGRLVVVDHHAKAGTGSSAAQELHRIDRDFAVRDWEAHGLRLVDSSDVLEGFEDAREVSVFDPTIVGKTARFVLVFEKP